MGNKCIYLTKDNERRLKQSGINCSGLVNELLEAYFKGNFDTSELSRDNNYKLVILRLHTILIRLLKGMKYNSNAKGVNEFVMYSVARSIDSQSGRRVFPDIFRGLGLRNITDLLKTLNKKADLFKVKDYE